MSVEQRLLEDYLRTLHLPTFVRNYQPFAEDAIRANQSYERFLLALAEHEINERDRRRQVERLKAAHLPLIKELADFDFSAIPSLNKQRVLDLAGGTYLHNVEPVILVGNPGLGKTHLATALAVMACRQSHRVRFYNVAALVSELIGAEEEHRLPRLMTAARKQDLIVLDELGYIPFSATGAQLLFQFCSNLYQRVTFIITTNLKFADWTQVFGDERLTMALLDRLTHRAHILEFVGESYRFRQRLQQAEQTEVTM